MTRTRGDLLLYRSSGRWYERLITLATKGPYVHVGIVVDPLTVIAARTHGIGYEAMPPDDNQHTTIPLTARSLTINGTGAQGEPITDMVQIAGRATEAGIEAGLAFAARQLGEKYSWLDIVYQGVKFLWPHNPLRFSEARHYDCSEFATYYLLQSGVVLPPEFDDPATVTPNDLARWAGLIGQPTYPAVKTPLRAVSSEEKTS